MRGYHRVTQIQLRLFLNHPAHTKKPPLSAMAFKYFISAIFWAGASFYLPALFWPPTLPHMGGGSSIAEPLVGRSYPFQDLKFIIQIISPKNPYSLFINYYGSSTFPKIGYVQIGLVNPGVQCVKLWFVKQLKKSKCQLILVGL